MAQPTLLETWSEELERLARVLTQVGPDEVCCEGLTARQCCILRTLVDKQGARLSDLAKDSEITPSAMTRVLEKLEAQGLVQRVRRQGKDARAAAVSITARGRSVRQRIGQLMIERTKNIVGAIPADLRPQLLASLRMLNQAMGKEGCCKFTGEWPEVSVSCKEADVNNKIRPRRRRNASQ